MSSINLRHMLQNYTGMEDVHTEKPKEEQSSPEEHPLNSHPSNT